VRFGEQIGLQDLTFSIPPGVIFGLIGPSGCGKTTTVRLLTGLYKPTEGAVRVMGEEPSKFRTETRERIGYMPQHSILYPDLTVGENVDFAGSLFGLLLFRRRKRKRQVLELLDLWSVRGRKAGQLSGGMQRRVSLACALVHEPAILVLDEPTAGIDPILRRTVWDELHRQRDKGTTVIATTQYVTEAEECDAVALIARGRVVAYGTPEELRRRAIGGDVVEITTDALFDIAVLEALPSVRSVRQTGAHEFRVIVDDAGTATPQIVDAVNDAGGGVDNARESRPSFEEVFTTLVEQELETSGESEPGDAEPGSRDAAPAVVEDEPR
jgi:ABC-2 type transport system ATP-binding protein